MGTGVGYALVTGDGAATARYVLPALAYLPAVLVLSGVARLLHGLRPRLLVLAWLPLAGAVAVVLLGPVLDLPGWLQGLSPFDHVPPVPAEELTATPVLVLIAVATLLSLAGRFAFSRRDIG